MDVAQLIREFGPIAIVWVLFIQVLPRLLKDMGDVGANRARIQDRVFEGSVDNVTLLLKQNQQERDRNSEAEAAMREAVRYLSQEVERLTKLIDLLTNLVKALADQIQAIGLRVDGVVIKVNDMDERLGTYVASTKQSVEVIANHIKQSKLEEKSP
jgi:ABC-type transporter Mla subunit MlaD